jgi:hypothetical protein
LATPLAETPLVNFSAASCSTVMTSAAFVATRAFASRITDVTARRLTDETHRENLTLEGSHDEAGSGFEPLYTALQAAA